MIRAVGCRENSCWGDEGAGAAILRDNGVEGFGLYLDPVINFKARVRTLALASLNERKQGDYQHARQKVFHRNVSVPAVGSMHFCVSGTGTGAGTGVDGVGVGVEGFGVEDGTVVGAGLVPLLDVVFIVPSTGSPGSTVTSPEPTLSPSLVADCDLGTYLGGAAEQLAVTKARATSADVKDVLVWNPILAS